MTFSTKVKKEILNQEQTMLEKISLLSSYLRNDAVITEKSIIINSDNEEITNYIFKQFKEIYETIPKISVRKKYNFKKNLSYILEITSNKNQILKDLSLINENNFLINIPKPYLYEDEELKTSYIKGLFLSTGSINDPNSNSYHLEFSIDDYEYAIFICELLDAYELNSKITERKNGYLVYIKEAEKISDFLKIIKTYNSVLYFEKIKIEKERKNLINRLNNCEQANVEKSLNSSFNQIKDIDLIEDKVGLDVLEEKLQTVAIYRKKYPETTLKELSEIISLETQKKVTKSGLNHRLRKIKEIAHKLDN